MREVSWQPYPASVAEAERQPCGSAGCASPAVLVRIESRGAAAALVSAGRGTTTTVWCSDHAQKEGYEAAARTGEVRGRPNALQRVIIRLLSRGEEPRETEAL